jgi:penicillin-binding protein 2
MQPKDRRLRWQPDTPDDGEPDKGPARRLALLRLFVVGVFAVLVLQLAHVQIANGYRYKLLAQNNLIKVIPNSSARGLVFDRMGRPLVQNQPVFSAVVLPSQLPDEHRQDVYYALQSNLGISAADIEQQVNDSIKQNGTDTPVTIKADIDETAALKLAEMRSTIPAIDVRTQPSRSYAAGALLSRVLGYVGKVDDNEYKTLSAKGYQLDDQVGKTGIELNYEDTLRGVPGKREVEVDASGHELRTLQEVPSQPGDNLTLSIDSTLQQGVTDILQRSLQAYKSASGVAIMMDVHTGEILAYVSLPSYDDNLFSGPVSSGALQQLLTDPGRPLVDHAISDQYPPGSTFKEITGLAALQEGVATANTTIVTNGKLVIGDQGNASQQYIFPDWMNLGTLDFYRGVAMSSDVYFYCLAGGCPQFGHEGLGSDALARYARMFGLGEKTGIDLPDEVPGIVPDRLWKDRTIHEPWVTADTYFMGIGQEYLATTPLQMLRVVASIANGGDILRPHLVHEIRDASGNIVPQTQSNVVRHVAVSPENFTIMRQAMLQVVQSGSATQAQVPGVAIAGKSGTAEYGAQLTSPSGEAANGTYNEHGWFVSYAPYDNPQVALVVFHERGGGALSTAPTTSAIWDYYFHQYLPQVQAAKVAAGTSTSP